MRFVCLYFLHMCTQAHPFLTFVREVVWKVAISIIECFWILQTQRSVTISCCSNLFAIKSGVFTALVLQTLGWSLRGLFSWRWKTTDLNYITSISWPSVNHSLSKQVFLNSYALASHAHSEVTLSQLPEGEYVSPFR